MVTQLVNYYQRLSKDFWLHNYIASFIYFLLFGQDHLGKLIVYPLIVATIHFANHYIRQAWLYTYVGYQTLSKDVWSLIATFFVNLLVWQSPITILLILLVIFVLRDDLPKIF